MNELTYVHNFLLIFSAHANGVILVINSLQSVPAADTSVNHEPDAFKPPYLTNIHAVYVVGVFDVVLGGVGNQKIRNCS